MLPVYSSVQVEPHDGGIHRNRFIASLQLLIWILFYPSGWYRYVNSVAPSLKPDCTLIDIGRTPRPRLLLLHLMIAYTIYLPLVALSSVAIFQSFGHTGDVFVAGVIASIAITVFYFVLAGTWISVAVGIILSVPGSLFFSLAYAITSGMGYPLPITTEMVPICAALYGLIIGLGGGLAGTVTSNITDPLPSDSLSRRGTAITGIYASVLLGAVLIYTLHSLLRFMVLVTFGFEPPGSNAQNLPLTLAFLGLAIGLYIALVGWSRARQVLTITLLTLFSILAAFVIFSRFSFLRGTTIGFTVGFIALIGLPFTVVDRIAGPRIAAFATAVGLGIGWIIWMTTTYNWPMLPNVPLSLGCIIGGATLSWWYAPVAHPFLEMWNLLVMRFDERRDSSKPSLLRWHAAFWHETHRMPLNTLDAYLVFVADRNPQEAQAAIEYLSNSRYQRQAAQTAQIELYARQLARVTSVEELSSVAAILMTGELDSPVSSLLRGFSRIGLTVNAALNSTTIYHKRLALNAADEHLDALLREMIVSNNRYTFRFRPIALHWRHIIAEYLTTLTSTPHTEQEIDNPYIFGLPLAEYHELFVGRGDIAARIEQLIVDRRRPPLLLYGQRRMGKTSLLRNLGRLLPSNTVLLFVDGEGVSGATDFPDFLYATVTVMVRSADHYRKISYLEDHDVLALIEQPVTDFSLRYDPAASRRILHLTRGHPHLVQLLCYETVDLKNRQPPSQRFFVTADDVEAAVQQALQTGDFFFADLSNQVGTTGTAMLRSIAAHGPNALVDHEILAQERLADFDDALKLLLRRDLIEVIHGGYRFQVELIRRWFAQL